MPTARADLPLRPARRRRGEDDGPYGLVVAVAPLFGVAYVAPRGATPIDDGPEASWSEVTPNLGWLLLGSVFAAALVNAGPIATGILADTGRGGAVTQFSYGVLMPRSRCSCSRPSRRHCSPALPDLQRKAT